MISVAEELINVRYKFKNENEVITIPVTEKQYINLLTLPIIDKHEIIGIATKPMAESEKKIFNDKIRTFYENDPSHTKFLVQ